MESVADDEEQEETPVKAYDTSLLKQLNVGCTALPPGVDAKAIEEAEKLAKAATAYDTSLLKQLNVGCTVLPPGRACQKPFKTSFKSFCLPSLF